MAIVHGWQILNRMWIMLIPWFLQAGEWPNLTGVSILQENLNYSPALSVICQILLRILLQLQSYRCILTRGIDPFFVMILWGRFSAKCLFGCTWGCLRGDVPPSEAVKFSSFFFWNWNRAIWWILLGTNLSSQWVKIQFYGPDWPRFCFTGEIFFDILLESLKSDIFFYLR